MDDFLSQAKAELARWQKIVELLEAGPSPTPSSAKPKAKSKINPAGKAYWTPARRAEMSRKIKALAKKKKPGAQGKPAPPKA